MVLLLGIKLHDQLLIDRYVHDILSFRHLRDQNRKLLVINLKPTRRKLPS